MRSLLEVTSRCRSPCCFCAPAAFLDCTGITQESSTITHLRIRHSGASKEAAHLGCHEAATQLLDLVVMGMLKEQPAASCRTTETRQQHAGTQLWPTSCCKPAGHQSRASMALPHALNRDQELSATWLARAACRSVAWCCSAETMLPCSWEVWDTRSRKVRFSPLSCTICASKRPTCSCIAHHNCSI